MVKVLRFFLYYLYLYSVSGHYLRRENTKINCNICDQYTISFKNELWVEWFYHECYDYKKRKKNREKINICFYYDKKLGIYKEDFWNIWKKCDCIYEDLNINYNFRTEL